MWKAQVSYRFMRILSVIVIVAALFFGPVSNIENVAGMRASTEKVAQDQSFDRLRHIVGGDGYSGQEENYGATPAPENQPLEVHKSDDPWFEYMASTPYYTVYFKGPMMKLKVKNAWIELEIGKQEWGVVKKDKYNVEDNKFFLQDVYEAMDLSYKVEASLLTEVLIMKEFEQFDRIIQRVSWEGATPTHEEDGSIVFSKGDTTLVKILPPFMRDAKGSVCTDLHYEIAETETEYELHKVIDERGLDWLKNAVFPVVVDPTMQTFEDAWRSSGLQPYGQYFRNLTEYVNPVNGHLIITQTDLVILGRGLDFVISRVYETPAVFHWENPYEFESPPVDVGKGWQLDFPYVGTKYLHLWGGTIYLVQWTGNQFENHIGNHFILVKNGDNTYSLTMVDGTVYEFNTSGKLTLIFACPNVRE